MKRLPVLAAALLVGCLTSESAYLAVVEGAIKKGPVAACCPAFHGVDPEKERATCEAKAPASCAFVKDATSITKRSLSRFGHDDGALVTVNVSGPNGHGICVYQVLNYPRGDLHIDYGFCTP
jgi:hypothetical protein